MTRVVQNVRFSNKPKHQPLRSWCLIDKAAPTYLSALADSGLR